MKFERKSFMGVELDILTGHPEHELLFIANQAAHAAGIKDPSHKARDTAKRLPAFRVSEVLGAHYALMKPAGMHPPTWHKMWLMPESSLYAMLLKGHAPQSEPFRRWVTEEVLPSIRKTGAYNAADSASPIAQAVLDELKMLRGEMADLKALVASMSASTATVSASPYEGCVGQPLWQYVDRSSVRKAYDLLGLPATFADKRIGPVMVAMEALLLSRWKGGTLRTEKSAAGKEWTIWPKPFLRTELTHETYREVCKTVVVKSLG